VTPFEPLGLDHVVLRVSDQDVSRRFYTEVLGCRVDHFNERISLLQLRFGEQMIDLLPGRPSSEGLDHFCLSIRCADLEFGAADAVRAGRCASRATSSSGAEPTAPGLPCTFRDPDGYLIELKPR
jgi:catechol 2,3-dioxygenase-like lactoylglutathione lyase family enzyme